MWVEWPITVSEHTSGGNAQINHIEFYFLIDTDEKHVTKNQKHALKPVSRWNYVIDLVFSNHKTKLARVPTAAHVYGRS